MYAIDIRTKEGKIIAKAKGTTAHHIVGALKNNGNVKEVVRKTVGDLAGTKVLEITEDCRISVGQQEVTIYLNEGYYVKEV